MKTDIFLAILLILTLTACAGLPASGETSNANNFCGDGKCERPENAGNCPVDCAGDQPSESPATEEQPVRLGDAPLLMTTMTHMEKGFDDDTNEILFNKHIEELTYGMDMADAYGALLTIESEQPFAIANTTWGRNFMAEILARGHGVGTHCDFGFRSPRMPVNQYALFFAENKRLVDDLVGAENNLGCSGGGGANDWALAANQAGFKYLDGIVGMHYLSMPLENRPDPSWTDDFITNTGKHINAPVDLYERIYPFMVADATDFVADADGIILVSSGELGALAAMEEGANEVGGTTCNPDCALTSGDVETLVNLILEVDRNRDRTRVAKLTVYLPANIFLPENEAVLVEFFSQMQNLAEQGIITWATQKDVYEVTLNWNE